MFCVGRGRREYAQTPPPARKDQIPALQQTRRPQKTNATKMTTTTTTMVAEAAMTPAGKLTLATPGEACLAFDKVGLVGRETEIRILLNTIRRQSKKQRDSSSSQDSPAGHVKAPTSPIKQLVSNNALDTNTCSSSSSSSNSSSSGGGGSTGSGIINEGAKNIRNEARKDSPTSLPKVANEITTLAAQSQIRSLVLISGQSGSGKSTLVKEARERLLSQTTCCSVPDKAQNSDGADEAFHGFFATGKCELSTKKEGVPYAGIQSAMMELCEQVANRAHTELNTSTGGHPSKQVAGAKQRTLASLVSKGLSRGEVELLAHVIPNIETIVSVQASHQSALAITLGSTKLTAKRRPASALSSSPHVTSNDSVSASAFSVTAGNGPSINYKSHTQRITYVLRRFMQILCTYCPVVMAIDDLQWADRESLALVQSWLLDSRSTSLTIIGLYRSNMLDANQTLKATLASLEDSKRERSIRIVKLLVEDLNVDGVAAYLRRLFRVSSLQHREVDSPDHSEAEPSLVRFMPLAEVVHAKTGGNLFFIQQYLDSLVKDGLVTHSLPTALPTTAEALPEAAMNDLGHSSAWAWDVKTVTVNAATSGNGIMDLMKTRLQKSASKHWILSIAACLGATFSSSHVCAVIGGLFIHSSHSKFFREVFQVAKIIKEAEIVAALKVFRSEKLIEKTNTSHSQSSAPTDGSPQRLLTTEKTASTNTNANTSPKRSKSTQYSFVHDKVQEAALAVVPTEDQLAELKYRVGEILLYALSEDELNDKIFMITNLLNTRPDLMPGYRKLDCRMKIIMLNHKAGQQAASSSAFHLASSYFDMAIHLLPDNHWRESPMQSLELYSSAAETHFVITSFAKAQMYCKEIIAQNCDVLNKVRAYHTLIDISLSEIETTGAEGAVGMSLDLLSQLGCTVPSSSFGRVIYILRGLVTAKRTVRRLQREMRDTLSMLNDDRHEAVMKTLDKLNLTAYLVAPDLIPLIAQKALRLSLKRGITTYASSALSFQAAIVAALMEDVDVAYKYGQLALGIVKASDDRSLDAKILFYHHTSIHHWKHPIESSIDPLLEASRSGMSTGDVETGAWCLYAYIFNCVVAGKPLTSIDKDSLVHTNTMRDFQQTRQYQLTLMLWQAALNLRGASSHTTALIGDAYNERDAAYDENHRLAEVYDRMHGCAHLYLATYFGDYQFGSEIAIESCLEYVKQIPSSFTLAPLLFNGAFCCFGMANRCKPSYYTKHARTFMKILKRWAKKGNPNCVPYLALLNAEESALKKQDRRAMEQYEEAIRMMKGRGYIHDQALANERYSAFYATRGDREKAKLYLKESICLNKKWGANKKVEMLLQQYRSDYE